MSEKYSLYEPKVQAKLIDFSKEISDLIGYTVILEAKLPEPISPDYIVRHVCEMLGLDIDFVKSKSRKKEAVEAYQIATIMIRDRFHPSLKEIAKTVKTTPVDHSSIIFRLQQHEDWMESDKSYKRKFELCKI